MNDDPRSASDAAWADKQRTAKSNGADEPALPLEQINPAILVGKSAPPRQFLVRDWVPMVRVTGLYGSGGEGKTTIVQQLATALAIGTAWLGLPVRQCNSLLLFCEDDLDEMHRRQEAINAHYGCDFASLDPIRWLPRLGEDNILMTFDRGKAMLTKIFEQLLAAAGERPIGFIATDTLADVFGGNESDRTQSRLFVQQALGQLARRTGAAVMALAHPSLTGINSGSGASGSTSWVGTFRSHLCLSTPENEEGEPVDDNARILSRKKTNVARRGETIDLTWRDGVFVAKQAPTGIIGSIERRTARRVFLDLLRATVAEKQPVSSNSRTGNYAPRLFVKRPDRERFKVADFERAMQELFVAGEIENVEIANSGHRATRILPREQAAASNQLPRSPDGK
jgi:RecA-family ATPase